MTMRYKVEIVINMPRDRMISLFDDPDNLKKWQPTFLGIEHMEGIERTKGVLNINKNFFYSQDGKTRWVTDTEFLFSNLPMKLMGLLLPFMFKAQTKKMMGNFKRFAESSL